MSTPVGMMLGALAMASFTAGLFFLRFWRDTRDRFFVYFALAFFIEAAERVVLGALANPTEMSPVFYLIRVLAFGLIVVAIIDKNSRKRTSR